MQRRDFDFAGFSYHETSSYTQKKVSNQPKRHEYMDKVEIWVCRICDKDYASKGSLNRHISTAHEQPMPRAIAQAPPPKPVQRVQQSFICRYCGGEYSSQGNLNRHVSTIHLRPKAAVAISNTTNVVQKKKTNVTVNVYKPVTYINNRYGC